MPEEPSTSNEPSGLVVPVLRADSGNLAATLKGRSNLKVTIDGLEVRLQLPPDSAEILGAVDGKRTIAEVHQAVSGTVGELKGWDAFKPAFDRVYVVPRIRGNPDRALAEN